MDLLKKINNYLSQPVEPQQKVKLLIDSADELLAYEQQSYAPLFDKVLCLIRKHEMVKEEISLLSKYAYLLRVQGIIEEALLQLKKALQLAEQINNAESIANCYNSIGVCYFVFSKYEEALNYLFLSLEKAEIVGDLELLKSAYYNIGMIHTNRGNLKDALISYQKSLHIGEQVGDYNLQANALNSIGGIYLNKNDLENATTYFYRSLSIGDKVTNLQITAATLNSLGSLNNMQGKPLKGLYYFQKAAAIAKQINDLASHGVIILNIAAIYSNTKKEYLMAFEYLKKAEQIANKLQNKHLLSIVKKEMGNIYFEQSRNTSALKYFEESLKIANTYSYQLLKAGNLIKIASIYYGKKEYEYALKHANNVLQLTKEISLHKEQEEALCIIINCHKALNNFEILCAYYEELVLVKQTIYDISKSETIEQLHAEYQAKEQAQEIEQQKILLLEKQAMNEILQQKNKELENFARVASHDLKAPLRIIISFSQLLQRSLKNEEEETKEYLEFIDKSAHKMNQLIEDLIAYARTGIDLKSAKPINLNYVLADVQKNLMLPIKQRKAILHIPELPLIKGHYTLLLQLFQNMLGNALKYQKENTIPIIKISFKENPNQTHWDFCISDNGIGIDQKYFEKILMPFKRLHTNKEYPGSGLGLASCVKIVTIYHSTIKIQSQKGQGTTFSFSLPKG